MMIDDILDNFRHLRINTLIEIIIFFANLFGGLVLTRHISLEDKSFLVLSTVLPSLYVAINQSYKTESIFTKTHLKSSRWAVATVRLLSIFSMLVVLIVSKYGVAYWFVIILLCLTSAQNSAKLALVYIQSGRIRYSSLRLLHIICIQTINLMYVLFFIDIDPIFVVAFYLVTELMLLICLHRSIHIDLGILTDANTSTKMSPFLPLAVILGTSYETVLVYLVAIVSDKSTLSLFSVALSVISPFFIVSSVGVPLILSRSNYRASSNMVTRKKSLIGFGLLFFFLCTVFGIFLSNLVVMVFGNNYIELSKSTFLLIPAGLIMVVSRLLDAQLRKNHRYLTSFLCNTLSLTGFSIFFSMNHRFGSDFCTIFFLGTILQIIVFGVCKTYLKLRFN